MIPGCPTPSHSAAQRRAPVLKRSSNPSLRVAGLQAHATTPSKVPTGVYVNQINLHKLSSCLQNQKPCMINVNTIQRKGGERRRLGPYSLQSVDAASAVSLAIGHNPGWVATPTQYTSMLALILPTSERWQAELTPPGIDSTAERDLNSGPLDPKPTTLTIKPTPDSL